MYDARRGAGRGDMPYPPEYPKMPGEPKRVQPSRSARRHLNQRTWSADFS